MAFKELAPLQVSSASTPKVPCHVFINHCGKDVKHTFATAIYKALTSVGLNVCLDVEWLKPGDEITSELEAAMRSASVHIAIFSEKYAQSPWCLDELWFMVETGKPVIPIFYGVQPSDLRYVAEGVGIYVDAFVKHVLDGRYSFEKIVEWNRALHQISLRIGYVVDLNNNSDEGDVLKKIVDDVHGMLSGLSRVLYDNAHVVGIEDKISEVIKHLEWDNDKPAVAVVIHGIGGAGKTTLANEVYATLNLQGWKHSKITFTKNLESNPNIEDLQSQILQDLTGIKPSVRDWQNGQHQLKYVLEREAVFIYIDNILWIKYLEILLPKQITSQKKVRILATARNTNASGVFESCGIKPCKLYSIESLSLEAALTLLCRKIDGERDAKSIAEERPQAKDIADKCSNCPLFLEVVGAYLHKRNNCVEAYERVYGWLRDGEPFSCHKDYSFDGNRILFSYHELESSAKEAFLDICSFFNGWEWEEVALIVGVEELQCLQDGALVKKIEVEAYDYPQEETKVEMINVHDLLLAAGRNMPENYRFRGVDDFKRALEDKKILHQTKGVWLNYIPATDTPFQISADVIDAMSGSLRVFAMEYFETIVNGQCKKHFDKLRFLQGYRLHNLGIDLSKLKHLICMDYTLRQDDIWSPPKNISSLQVLKLKKFHWRNMDQPIELGHLNILKHLTLSFFHINQISSFLKLNSLEKLELFEIQGLEKSADFKRGLLWKLRSLQALSINYCQDLKKLPAGIGELSAVTKLNLDNCNYLEELPCDFEKLSALQLLKLRNCWSLLAIPEGLGNMPYLTYIDVRGCRKLSSLPSRVAERCVLKGRISLEGCKSLKVIPIDFNDPTCVQELVLRQCECLQELCNNFHCLVGLRTLDLSGCKSLSRLPQGFGKLGCLERLELSGCNKLEELSSDFGCLGALEELKMSGCKSLSKLPQSFGELGCLQNLNLSECDILEELCSNFGFLGALKYLTLSRCKSLSKLPQGFGKLGCLEILDLSECNKLEELSSDFHCLPSLARLNLSRNEILGGTWMDKVEAIQSLWFLDITGSERMIQRCIELEREKKGWHFVAVTDSRWKRTEGHRDLLLRGMISKVFDEEGLLIDIHQRPFYSSSVLPDTPLIFVIHQNGQIECKFLEKYMQSLSSKALSIIYVGKDFQSLTPELRDRILAYTPPDSKISSFFDKFHIAFPRVHGMLNVVFRSSEDLEEKEIKRPSIWEDISYVLNEVTFLFRTPQESSVEILRAVLQTDSLLLNNSPQVKLTDLQGKVILLLYASVSVLESAFRDVYVKMRESHHHLVEVVWIPDWGSAVEWDELKRAPWPVVPNAHLVSSLSDLLIAAGQASPVVYARRRIGAGNSYPRVVVVDGKGRFSNKNAFGMIERWGVEAYPFSSTRKEELRMSEWEKPFTGIQFIFKNLEFGQTKGNEASPCGEMTLCVGTHDKMLEFTAELYDALAKLKDHFQVVYVRCTDFGVYPTEDHETKRKRIGCTIPSISISEAKRFWQRVKNLYGDLKRVGSGKKIIQGRRNMVLSVVSAEVGSRLENEIQVIVVDKNGEMMSGRGKQIVQALWRYGSNDPNALSEVKIEGVRQVMQGQWKDGIIDPKHHPEHLLFLVDLMFVKGCFPICGLCSYLVGYYFYRCSVCQNYVSCVQCLEDDASLKRRI